MCISLDQSLTFFFSDQRGGGGGGRDAPLATLMHKFQSKISQTTLDLTAIMIGLYTS